MITKAPMWRRFAAILYDVFLVFSLLFIMGFVYRLLFGNNSITVTNNYFIFYQFYLFIVALFYFCFSWLRIGQTLGMKSWHIKLINADLSPLSLQQVLVRFFTALLSWTLLGGGFLYALTNSKRLTWHDKLSKSQLIKITKTAK